MKRPPRDDFRKVDGLVTHATVTGEGPPIVIVPGMGCAAFVYTPLVQALQAHFTVWVYQPPGAGRSQERRGEHACISEITDHLAQWLAATGLTNVAMIGHSMGGEVAIDLITRRHASVSRLVLLASTGVPQTPNLLEQALRLLIDGTRESPGLLWRIWASYTRFGVTRFARLGADQHRHHTVPRLRCVHVPVLILGGTRDPVIPKHAYEVFRRELPAARTAFVPGSHVFFFRRPEETARHILAFLSDDRRAEARVRRDE